MKKSTRILSVLMAFVMLLGTFSVLGSAYQAYKNDAIEEYNDVDAPVFTLEQYATMALDEVDRMLAKEQISLNIYIGVLDLGSITETIASVESLLTSVKTLLPLLGDAASLKITAIEGDARGDATTERTTDLEIIYDLLDFIADNAEVFEKYVNGSLSLGIMDSFIASFKFNIRELATGLVYGFTPAGKAADYDYFDDGIDGVPAQYRNDDNGIITLAQELLNSLVLGEWKLLDDLFADPNSWVDYEDYLFEGEMDTAANDYYGWVHPDQWVTYALGGCAVVTDGAAAPAPDYALVDITTDKKGYDFIEALLQRAYNELLVPVLNRDTVPWLRRLCGVQYLDSKKNENIWDDATQSWIPNPDYVPGYTGEPLTDETRTVFADIFNMDVVVEKVTIPEGETFVDNFNDILGDFINNLLIVKKGVPTEEGYVWNWVDGGNQYLLTNVANVAKFVLQISGAEFFPEYFSVPSASELAGYTDQQVVALIMRGILNGSVGWMYIDDSAQSIVDVGYAAIEQLAWQDIPQYTYTKPVRTDYADDEAYYDAVVQKCLDILLDVAVYNLNQTLDMVPAQGSNPVTGAGLLPYQGDNGSWEATAVQVAAWAISTYGEILALEFNCDNANGEVTGLTMDDVWTDIDTLLNQIIPIKGDGAWIYDEIANSGLVSKAFIFDYLLKPIYTLDATNIGKIFMRNPDGAFATKNGVEIIMDLLNGIFDLLFPNVFSDTIKTVDALVQNDSLGTMIHDLFKSLGTKSFTGKTNGVTIEGRGQHIAAVALPVVCMILGLSDEQEFSEMENFLPETIAANTNPTFRIYNGSSGVNTGWTNTAGVFSQDSLYSYEIGPVVIRSYVNGVDTKAASLSGLKMGDTLDGGQSVDVTLQGTLTEGMLIEMNIDYYIKGEDGTNITDTALTKTVYAVVGNTDKDDDAIEISDPVGNRFVQYESEIYIGQGGDLNDFEGYQIRIKDSNENEGKENPADTGSVSIVSVSGPAFITKNPDLTTQAFKGQEGIYFFDPFRAVEGYDRYEVTYQTDENGELVLDAEGNPIPVGNNGGIEDGKYTVTTVVNVNGTNHTVTTNIHYYKDYDLGGKFSHEVAANRQQNDYDMDKNAGAAADLWANYIAALKDAAVLCLTPKTGSTFESKINNCADGYANLYEQYAVALDEALAALAPYEKSAGVGALQDAIEETSGYNWREYTDAEGYPYRVEIEYWETDYVFVGMRDYAPHSYRRYRDARGNAQDIVDSQVFFVPAPFADDYVPSEEEKADRAQAIAEYNEKVATKGVVGAIEATYALHKLELMESRLIKLPANNSKLQVVYDMCVTNGGVNASGASYYTAESWENYTHAKDFATKVLGLSGSSVTPSMVNVATSELVDAWKHLVKSCDFTNLDAAIELSAEAGALGLDQTEYKPETYEPFYALYTEAVNFDRGVADNEDNQAEIDKLATDLTAAFNALEEVSAVAEPEYPVIDSAEAIGMMLFHSQQWDYFFAPWLDTESVWNYVGTTYGENGDMINGYILGLGVGIGEYELDYVFNPATRVNTTVEIQPTAGGYGTGTLVLVKNETTGEILAAYQAVIRGDVNGDGFIDSVDADLINIDVAGVSDWKYDSYGTNDSYNAVAADVTGDMWYDSGDADQVMLMGSFLCDVNQETGEVIMY